MQMALMVFFTLPCGLCVTLCHIYVFIVANRHKNAIKRDNIVRDRMMNSASFKLTTTSEAVVLNMEQPRENTRLGFVTFHRFFKDSLKNQKGVKRGQKLT